MSNSIKSSISNNFLIFVAIGIILFIDNVDINALSVALPIIAVDIGVDLVDMHWVINIYFILAAAFFMFAGYFGERWGLRNTLCLGIGLILFSSLMGGLAESASVMLLSRALQGIGFAFTFSMLMLVTSRLLTEKQRNVGMGIFMAVSTASAMVGPVLGSVLTHYIGWQAIFFLNVVLCIPCLWILITRLENTNSGKAFNWREIFANLLLTLGILGVVLLIDITSNSLQSISPSIFSSEYKWALVLGSVLSLASFAMINRRLDSPILNRNMFNNKTFVDVNLFRILLQLVAFSFFFWVPLFLQLGLGYGIVETGFVVAVFTSTAAICSLFSGYLAEKVGRYKTLLLSHLVLILGVSYLLTSHPHYDIYDLVIAFVLIGAGVSALFTMVNVIFLSSLTDDAEGMLTGTYYTVSYIAGSIGVIITVLLLGTHMTTADEVSFTVVKEHASYLHAMKSIVIFWLTISAISAVFCFFTFKEREDKALSSDPLLNNDQ
jgi:MFS family permease